MFNLSKKLMSFSDQINYFLNTNVRIFQQLLTVELNVYVDWRQLSRPHRKKKKKEQIHELFRL